jgi:hypothetical protein
MTNTYIKPSSYTQHEAERLIFDKQRVLKLAAISYEQHEDLMFEYGCQFAERVLIDRHFQLSILTDEELGFWQWWRLAWAKDDSGLIKTSSFNEGVSYQKMKSFMITNDLLRMGLKDLLMYA